MLVASALTLGATAVSAAPWIEPGDMRMRHSLQKMADHGQMNTPINTWPVMWAGVGSELGSDRVPPGGDLGTERSYIQFEQARYARPGWKAEVEFGAVNQPALIRSFNSQTRDSVEAGARVHWTGREWAVGLSGQYVDDPADERNFRADGSFIAYTGGDWTMGVGAIDRWWGPGWQSSLMLSNNARPVPSVFLNRTRPQRPDHPLLSWIGPWQFTVTLGQLENDRQVSEPLLVGMRFNARPVRGLEVGLSRMFIYGGDGEPRNGSALWSGLTGRETSDLTGDERASQKMGADFRYGLSVGEVSGGVYAEAVGQWGEGREPSRFMGLAGADLAFPVGHHSQRWFVEYADTTAGNIVGRDRDNVAYEDERYRTGHRYRGRNMGSTFDSDALALTLGLQHYLINGRSLQLTATHAKLNRSDNIVFEAGSDDVDYAVASESTEVFLANLRYEYPIWGGWMTLDGQWSDRRIDIETADGSGRAQGTFTAGWCYRF